MNTPQPTERDDVRANRYRLSETFRDMTALYGAIALLAMVFAGVEWARGRELAGRPTAEGRILVAETVIAPVQGRIVYTIEAVRLVYGYQVDGRAYESDRIRPGQAPIAAASELGQSLLADYPPGAPVDVRYDPDNPAQALILTDDPNGAAAAVGPMAMLVAVVAFAAAVTRRLSRPPA